MFKRRLKCLLVFLVGIIQLVGATEGLCTDQDTAQISQPVSAKCGLGSLAEWNIKRLADCHSMEVFEFPAGSKNQVGRFEIKPTDPKISNGWRAEIKDPHYAVNGDRTWYRFTTLIPMDFPTAQDYAIVTAQWHESQFAGNPSQRPPIAHRLTNGEFRVTIWNDHVYNLTKGKGNGLIAYAQTGFALGKVHEFIYRVDWRPDASGSLRAWKRECELLACDQIPWTEFINYRGAIGYRNVIGYYFKAGVYTVHPFASPMSVYHTAFGRGPTPESIGIDPLKDIPFRNQASN